MKYVTIEDRSYNIACAIKGGYISDECLQDYIKEELYKMQAVDIIKSCEWIEKTLLQNISEKEKDENIQKYCNEITKENESRRI